MNYEVIILWSGYKIIVFGLWLRETAFYFENVLLKIYI